jgi:citrate synthase
MTIQSKKEYLIYRLADGMRSHTKMDPELFKKLDVKRGLRNEDGTGVLVGLTNIGNVVGYERREDGLHPIEGKLYFRGYEVADIVKAIRQEERFGFEEVAYLLLSGELPDREQLKSFRDLLYDNMSLDKKTLLHIIEMEGHNVMNILERSVLEMYTFDDNPDDISPDNLMRQSIELISKLPTVICYAYNMLRRNEYNRSLHIRDAKPGRSIAENFLYMLKGTGKYTRLDALTLDLLLILHSEHGGGNNSTFTVRVTSSTATDTYSSIAAGIGSLKGGKHGGANLKVSAMLDYLREQVKDWEDEAEIEEVLTGILNKERFDGTGLIYGIGHAVYTLSDPRTVLLIEMASKLAEEKGRTREFEFMKKIDKVAVRILSAKFPNKNYCANVDFYSGFVYDMIGIPRDIYTPLFAMARIVGWCAHRNEELGFTGRRIIRPAYRCITEEKKYVDIDRR